MSSSINGLRTFPELLLRLSGVPGTLITVRRVLVEVWTVVATKMLASHATSSRRSKNSRRDVVESVVEHVVDSVGLSIQTAAGAVATMTTFHIVGQLGGGLLGDRVSKRALAAGCMLLHATAMIILAYATSIAPVFLFAVLHGLWLAGSLARRLGFVPSVGDVLRVVELEVPIHFGQ